MEKSDLQSCQINGMLMYFSRGFKKKKSNDNWSWCLFVYLNTQYLHVEDISESIWISSLLPWKQYLVLVQFTGPKNER